MENIGKALLIIGAILVVTGLIALGLSKFGFAGKLPGDIAIKTDKGVFYFPLVTSIIVSLVLTLLGNILFRLWK